MSVGQQLDIRIRSSVSSLRWAGHSNDNTKITQAGVGSQTLRSGTVDFEHCVAPSK